MSYVESPSDEQVAELLARATVLVQTSTHEGFCLPPLESMATGGAVVCTDAHGNRDFCVDGENCLMPAPDIEAVSAALARMLGDSELRGRLGRAGIETARDYTWERRIDALEGFLEGVRATTPDYRCCARARGIVRARVDLTDASCSSMCLRLSCPKCRASVSGGVSRWLDSLAERSPGRVPSSIGELRGTQQ